jgi:phage shock protein E
MSIQKAIQEGGALIDVRTPMAFMSGSVEGSINIPLNEIPHRVEELKEMEKPLILFCRSGGRSEQARAFLAAKGMECYNGGPWTSVNQIIGQLN